MKTYITTAALRLGSGLIEIDRAQAAARAYALEKTDTPDVYLISKPVEFKIGEKIGYDGAIPKGQAEAVVLAGSEAAEACNAVAPASTPKRSRKKEA